MDSCSNCSLMIKELNLLQRRISLLNLQLNELSSNVSSQTENESQSTHQGCQTDNSVFEIETESELSSLSSDSNTIFNLSHDRLNVFSYDIVNHEPIEPCKILPGRPFEKFDLASLDESTDFTRTFKNRLVAYYGDYPYTYGGAVHKPNPISSNKSLANVMEHVKLILPEVNFNSILITKYSNGNCHLPYHNDDEESISEDSHIVTISLGQSRVLKFRSLSDNGAEYSVNLSHGQVFTMSKKSQKFFEHSIPKDYSKQARISITLRFLNPPNCISTQEVCDTLMGLGDSVSDFPEELSANLSATVTSCPPTQTCDFQTVNSPKTSHAKSDTLYISSSMFRFLNEKKLSSSSQDSHVFFYPGATAGQMLLRFKSDHKVAKLNLGAVHKVILMTGTNNVDGLVGDTSGVIHEKTWNDISDLLTYLKSILPNAVINIVNLLPRKSYQRNLAVNSINNFLFRSSQQLVNVNFIDTELDRNLFSTAQGYRKSFYFIQDNGKIYDNPHLNREGIIRLAKHLKYIAHKTPN